MPGAWLMGWGAGLLLTLDTVPQMSCAGAGPADPVVPLMKPGASKTRVWGLVRESRFGPDVRLSVTEGDVVELIGGEEKGVRVKTQDGKIGTVPGRVITRPTSAGPQPVQTTIDFGFDEPAHMVADGVTLREMRDKIKWNLCVLYICCCTGPEQRRTFEQMLKLAVFNKVSFKKFAEETGILRISGGLNSCRTYEKMFADYWQEWNDQVATVKSAVVPSPSTLASARTDCVSVQRADQPTFASPEGTTYRVRGGLEDITGIKRSSDGVPKSDAARRTQKLDINTCDESKLMIVVGAGIARRIIEKRTELGGFKSMADLKQVAGVGGSKLEQFALRGFTVVPQRVKVAEEAPPATSRTESGKAESEGKAKADKRCKERLSLPGGLKRPAEEATNTGPAEKDEDVQTPRCPITQEPFKEPVLASCCGHSFERDAIMKWIHIDTGKNRGGAKCPLCDCPLSKRMLVPNRTLMQNPR